jgi:hypothetical protein
MARGYDARSVALAIDAPAKWLDNLLSHHAFPGVAGGRQGLQRHISYDGLLAIAVTRLLAVDLGLPTRRAAELAAQAVQRRDEHAMDVETPGGVTIVLPVKEIEARLRERLFEAAESVPRIRRGRPPGRATARTRIE